MLSRVADAVFWMSRYIERAENIARFVDANESLTLDLPGDRSHQWRSLVSSTGEDSLFVERYGSAYTRSNVMRFLLLDSDYRSSTWSCLRAARENARSVREIISSDVWGQINRAYHLVKEATRREDDVLIDPESYLHQLKSACYRVNGSIQLTMTHNDAWHFMQVGRLLERADKTSRILDVKYFLLRPSGSSATGTASEIGGTEDDLQWSALLQSVSGLEMYRQRCGVLEPRKVVTFLLLDRQFPRAIRFCVTRAEKALHSLDVGGGYHPRNQPERRLGRLRAELEFGEVADVLEQGLHDWVDDFQRKLNTVGLAMQNTFFDLGPPSQSQSQSQS